MKRIVCSIFLGVVILSGTFALTNGEYVRNIALLVSRWDAWKSQCVNFLFSQFNTDGQYIGSSYEDFVFQYGMHKGITKALSEEVDKCIALNLRMTNPEAYGRYLKIENSDILYQYSQKDSLYYGLSDERKNIYDAGYFRGYMSITDVSTRFPSIWEYHY
jgi:hypothetical protein